jgi:hypothetical protein
LLLGGTTFLIESQTTAWSITVVDNGPNDHDPRDGIFEILFVPLDNHPDPTCFTVTEIIAPEGYDISEPQTVCLEAGIIAEPLTFVDYPSGGCTYTPGYWMTHSEYGPATYTGPDPINGGDPTWYELGDIDEDTISEGPDEQFFDSDETWLSIMSMKTRGNTKTYQQLAFHYVAAYLNGLYNGALPSEINTLLGDAEALLDYYDDDFKIPKRSENEAEAKEITSILGEFNEGCLYYNWPHCDDIGTLRVYKVDYTTDSGMIGWPFEIYSQYCDWTITKMTSGEGAYFEIELMAGFYNIGEIIPEGFEDWYLHDVYHYEDTPQIAHYEPPFSCGTKVENIQIKSGVITSLQFYNKENEPPVAMDDLATTDEDTPIDINVLANDYDPDGDDLIVTIMSQPSDGTASVNMDKTIKYTPDTSFTGDDSFIYKIEDKYGLTSTADVYVTVNNVNIPPTASISAPTTVLVGGSITLDASGSNDPDGTIVNYKWDYNNNQLYGEPIIESPYDGNPTFGISFGYVTGDYTFGVQVFDNDGATDTTTHTVTVIEPAPA